MKKVLSVYHPDSPARSAVEKAGTALFAVGDFKYELLSFTLVGVDKDYAYARLKQRTKLVKKPKAATTAGQQSEIDMLFAFKQSNKAWKVWTSMTLGSTVK